MLLGLTKPDRGRSQVLGLESASAGPEIRQRVGYVSDNPSLYDWMTVLEIGWFTAGFFSDGFLPNYRELVNNFELPENRKIKALSKGMRAKVALSLAMAHEPELLVLDEPTSGLDAMVRREFLESMVDIAGAGRTVLLSSHQIHEVERVADHVAIIRDGKLALVDELESLKANVLEVTAALDDGAAPPQVNGADILREERKARQWQALVRGVDEDALRALRNQEGVHEVQVRAPSLEEIFVGYMTADDLEGSVS